MATAAEIGKRKPRLLVFPEYTDTAEIALARIDHAGSIIAAAVEDRGRSRGILWHNDQNQIQYLKSGTDYRTQGVGNIPTELPVYDLPDICVGIVICMDVQNIGILDPVADRIRASPATGKFLCIPAAMQGHWFTDGTIAPNFHGINVILSNNPTLPDGRCKSFMTDRECRKVHRQIDREPIHFLF